MIRWAGLIITQKTLNPNPNHLAASPPLYTRRRLAPPPPPPPRVVGIRSGRFDEENPFVQNSSLLLVQPDEGVSVLVVDRIGDYLPQSIEKSRVLVIPVGARHKCQQVGPTEPTEHSTQPYPPPPSLSPSSLSTALFQPPLVGTPLTGPPPGSAVTLGRAMARTMDCKGAVEALEGGCRVPLDGCGHAAQVLARPSDQATSSLPSDHHRTTLS
ncbi:hypothetical protein F511_11723 [Dorcoceras hygrometricum]|uniref:Uncharacterized protein n=1 Tax=Dorcoceras hygrometricum TaxID=472368 RepID=A0A2Z7A5M1_9LAMI|nr:hypothetical protein F511_11723 [Dorcoceras hygrometricum]